MVTNHEVRVLMVTNHENRFLMVTNSENRYLMVTNHENRVLFVLMVTHSENRSLMITNHDKNSFQGSSMESDGKAGTNPITSSTDSSDILLHQFYDEFLYNIPQRKDMDWNISWFRGL